MKEKFNISERLWLLVLLLVFLPPIGVIFLVFNKKIPYRNKTIVVSISLAHFIFVSYIFALMTFNTQTIVDENGNETVYFTNKTDEELKKEEQEKKKEELKIAKKEEKEKERKEQNSDKNEGEKQSEAVVKQETLEEKIARQKEEIHKEEYAERESTFFKEEKRIVKGFIDELVSLNEKYNSNSYSYEEQKSAYLDLDERIRKHDFQLYISSDTIQGIQSAVYWRTEYIKSLENGAPMYESEFNFENTTLATKGAIEMYDSKFE